ncbi:MAG TPA: general stress protein CsbD [Bacteroidia bacterium]|nr:general stress protein CsbD [Bacteroidia bacterium]
MKSTEANINWNKQKEKLKERFVALTENDLKYDECQKDEMLDKLQIKLGKTKEELQLIMGSL